MEIQVKVPTSLNEIPLKHYVDFLNVQKGSNDEEFIAQKMIEIFCGIRLSDVANIKLTSLNEMVAHFTNLFSQKPEFTQTFKIGDVEFGFIPNLEEISFGEYVDLENSLQSWETYNKAMAVMYRPIKKRKGDKYEIHDYKPSKDHQELMQFAPLDVCIAASVFFYNLGNELLTATLNYLEKQMKMDKNLSMTLAKQLNLQNDGDGISQYMHSLKETLQDSMKLPHFDLLNVSPTPKTIKTMTGFYTITEALQTHFNNDVLVNTVTEGDIFEVDLNKQTIFPLVHVMVNNATFETNVVRFNISLLAMDIVNISKDETTNIFRGNANEQDVLNTQLEILNRAYAQMLHGNLWDSKVVVDGNPTCEPFTERFENYLAGWTMTFDVLIPNEVTIC